LKQVELRFTQDREITTLLSVDPPQTHDYGIDEFVIDTGSQVSILGMQFVDRLNLPVSRFDYNDGVGLIAGAKVRLERLDNIQFNLQGKNGTQLSGKATLHVPQYDGIPEADIDSILGLDFLQQHADQFCCDFNQDQPEPYLIIGEDS
jgi:hypothetical protein